MPADPPADRESGYASALYARSQAHTGRPRPLPRSGGWILEREIGEAQGRDAMGCYPLLACRDWSAVPEDLDACTDLVSLVAVPDPHGEHDPALLSRAFPDLVKPFKEHFVCELGDAPVGSRHHRYYARRALRRLEIEESRDPASHVDEWTQLYAQLIERHHLKGIHAFPRESFAAQLAVPGGTLLRALEHGTAVAAQLWYVRRGVAYSHLAATGPRGYELGAPYALHAAAATILGDRAEILHLGGGAGRGLRSTDGLSYFKAGWANATTTAYLVGRVLDVERYRTLAASRGAADTVYFPAYRAGELA